MIVEADEAFARDLVARSPVLAPVLAEHLEDNFDELLPRLFLADVMRRCVELSSGSAIDEVGPILEYLEARFETGDAHLDELISTAFVEVLPRAEEAGGELRRRLGPKLSAEAERVA